MLIRLLPSKDTDGKLCQLLANKRRSKKQRRFLIFAELFCAVTASISSLNQRQQMIQELPAIRFAKMCFEAMAKLL